MSALTGARAAISAGVGPRCPVMVEGCGSTTQAQRTAALPDCVEGWSCIAKWTGVPLGHVLDRAGVKCEARYVVFHCADTMDGDDTDKPTLFYGSLNLMAARHPQTILAYDMNGETLTVPHGAPLRVRVKRQLGYKMSKYIMRMELVGSYAHLGDGKGGYW